MNWIERIQHNSNAIKSGILHGVLYSILVVSGVGIYYNIFVRPTLIAGVISVVVFIFCIFALSPDMKKFRGGKEGIEIEKGENKQLSM